MAAGGDLRFFESGLGFRASPYLLRTHILWLWGPKTLLHKASGLFLMLRVRVSFKRTNAAHVQKCTTFWGLGSEGMAAML